MLFHLSRYFATEVLRVFLLTTAVLTTVIAFGAAIKPLAQDDLFSAGQIIRYVFAAMVPMLQYAMPVAAAFAVTLVIHRMASDNEIVAAAVSGVSYTRLLMPIAAFGVALVVVMSCFSHFITPKFLALLDRMISHDATMLVRTALQRDQSFQVGDLQIYADDMDVIDRPQGSGADSRMVLHRMAAVETDSTGRAKMDVTARQAVIDVFQRQGQTYFKVLFRDLVGFKGVSGDVFTFPELSPDRALRVPGSLYDSLDTRTTLQMYEVLDRPATFRPMTRARDQLLEALRDLELASVIRQQLLAHGELHLQGSEGIAYIVRAAVFAGGELRALPGEQVEVTQLENGRPQYRFLCERVSVVRTDSALEEQPSLELSLTNYRVEVEAATGRANVREQLKFSGLSLAAFAAGGPFGEPVDALLARADAMAGPEAADSPELAKVVGAAAHMRWSLEMLGADVAGRTLRRIALSFVVLVYVLAGMILSMLMRGAPALTIYTIVFVPSILCLMLIFGGAEVMRDGQLVTGGVIMWSGHAFMLVMCIEGLRRLLRN